MNAHAAVLEALIARNVTGRGASIEISMFDGMADWMTVPLLHLEHADRQTRRFGLAHASIYPYRPYECACGDSVVVAIQQPSEWKRFCETVLDRSDLADDPRFATNAVRVANREALDEVIEPIFKSLSRAEAISRLTAAQNAWGKVSKVRDLPSHQALRRIDVQLPNGSTVSIPRPPLQSTPLPAPAKVPGLGADTLRLRAEFAV